MNQGSRDHDNHQFARTDGLEGIQSETLPTWVLMLVLLIGFIILPAQVAEEKEKKLLLALLQTPINEVEWLIAKLILGMLLIMSSVLFLHLLGSFGPVHLFDYVAIIAARSFCFTAYGIFLGFLCRNQASAERWALSSICRICSRRQWQMFHKN